MIIHARIKKSKQKKTPKSVREQHDAWLAQVNSLSTNFSRFPVSKPTKIVMNKTYVRETKYYPSLNPQNMTPCTKPEQKVYTGDKMLGIGTLHKSNAVPVFTDTEAKDMANMRR
jgi:hypothetical protein